jgi:CopG antitoxin of type II toxin-antitoxin system
MKKELPKLNSEDREREFWSKSDSTEYVDWEKAQRSDLSNLKPSTKKISLRLPQLMNENNISKNP